MRLFNKDIYAFGPHGSSTLVNLTTPVFFARPRHRVFVYSNGYVRMRNGSWTLARMPGVQATAQIQSRRLPGPVATGQRTALRSQLILEFDLL
jgi:hypothetical protein